MPRPSPYDRLQEKLGKVGRAPTVDVGSAIDARRVKPGTKVPSGGVVTQRWGYRASIGKLGEDKAAHAMQPKVFITTDTNKLINEPGFDKAGLTFTAEGKFRYVSSDNKAYQKIGKISSVSAHERSLNFNLETERDRSLAIARDKARPYGERVLYRANSMVLKRILRNTSQAIKDGRLVLSVASHGGNATGISLALQRQGHQFADGRFTDGRGKPVAQQLKGHRVSLTLAKRFGINAETQINQDMSRRAMLMRNGYGGSQAPTDANAPAYRLTSGSLPRWTRGGTGTTIGHDKPGSRLSSNAVAGKGNVSHSGRGSATDGSSARWVRSSAGPRFDGGGVSATLRSAVTHAGRSSVTDGSSARWMRSSAAARFGGGGDAGPTSNGATSSAGKGSVTGNSFSRWTSNSPSTAAGSTKGGASSSGIAAPTSQSWVSGTGKGNLTSNSSSQPTH